RRLAPRSRPPNPFRRLILRQFLQAPPDRARRNPSRHRNRCDPTITRGESLRRRDQTTAAFIEKRGHRRKPLSDGFDIDHPHNIWYSNLVVNRYLTLPKVDSIICGRALSQLVPRLAYKRPARPPSAICGQVARSPLARNFRTKAPFVSRGGWPTG